METSERGCKLIEGFEDFKPLPYNDANNNSTIGFGTLLHYGPVDENNAIDKRWIDCGGVTREEASAMMLKYVRARCDPAIAQLVKVPLSQYEWDALSSFVYNVGEGEKGFAGSTLLRLLNTGNYNAVPPQFLRWNKSGGKVLAGLTERRKAESVLFETGVYPA